MAIQPNSTPTRAKLPSGRSTVACPPAMEYMRVTRVARLLDVSKKRVYQLVQEGKLEVIRLGPRQMRVLKGSLEQYIGGLIRDEEERFD